MPEMLMQFKHCGVHQREFNDLLNGVHVGGRTSQFPIVVGCRSCHQWYFAEHAPAAMSPELVGVLSNAERILFEECPDHPHRFVVASLAER
jgi:hypothetical protein